MSALKPPSGCTIGPARAVETKSGCAIVALPVLDGSSWAVLRSADMPSDEADRVAAAINRALKKPRVR